MKQAVLVFLAVGTAAVAQTAVAPATPGSPEGSPQSRTTETFALGLPLQCEPGKSCWVANYIDVDPGPGAQDFRCGARTYDGHDGIDFAIRDRGVMAEGVPVFAAASGVVRNVRDGMNDAGLSQPGGNEAVQGRECGNGVVIDHNGGWQTQYCHLRNGSVSVKPREFVAAGTRLGFVGMSGFAEFPHVHLAVRRDGMEVDPFTGLQVGDGCSAAALPLWNADVKLAYEPAALYNAGFSAGPPDVGRIRAGEQPAALDRQSPALVLWVDIFGVVQGDRILFTISGPEGNSIIEQDQTIEKTQARRYMYVGKRRTVRVWPAGTYIGKITLTRATSDGTPWQASVDRQITIP